ncbi:LLM class flavin-dependent oxidoreductase [Polymorphobacter sp.]|uniref:LLM class flavin-dependent oxidoreductase n=1 Tax=Polymorphobacter sp. TaxID=1909290 RepID=UPI003F6EE13C
MNVFGLLPYADETELTGPAASAFDPAFMRRMAEAFDRHGYERVLIAQSAASPDPMLVAASVLEWTDRLKVMIAHRPGFVAPTMAARMLATLDRMSGGRAGVHIITATNDAETQGDGDFLTKEQRYHRSREYVGLLRRIWAGGEAFDHDGDFYRTRGSRTLIRPVDGTVPIFWGGASGLGVQFGGECADCYALAGGTRATVARLVGEVRAAAAAAGRDCPRMLMSIRVVIAEDDGAAWARAHEIAGKVRAGARIGLGSGSDASAARRVAEAAAARTADDPCLWGGVIEATGGTSHAMALVGGPDELAAALRAYQAIGVDDVLLRGFDNLADADAVGALLVPRLG